MNSRKGKNISLTLVCAALILCMSACGKKAADNPNTNSYSVLEDLDFGMVNLNTSIEDFLADGYELGDSLDISFSNGQKLEDIPFYDGYYVRTNKPLIVAYPGYKYIAIGYSSGDSMWEMLEFSDSDTAQVSIRERGKYLNIQENLSAVYSDNRSDFGEDYVFANFRSLTGGNIKEDTFYRGASPIDNEHNRAGTVDKLIREVGIKYDFDLSDSAEEVEDFVKDNSEAEGYIFRELQKNNQVGLLNLDAAYRSDKFKKTLAAGLLDMMTHEGPYYIHCIEGKDRTGFVCILFEALCGADYSEIENDYMITYDNYYGITKEKTPEKYQAFVELRLDDMLGYLVGTEDPQKIKNADYLTGARAYLTDAGMSASQIDELIQFLSIIKG